MEHTNDSILVKVRDLVPSPFNVRRHSRTSVEELAALIDSQGLLHPLTVNEHEVGKGKSRKLKFAVPAGERRRRALLLLQERGRLPTDHEVACKLIAPERARAVSVAEKSGREPMHPADEFEAFKALVDKGKGIEDVAVAFGVSLLTVQRRLKLSAVSPKLLALYREDDTKINLDQLMALAISDDHAAQERAWFEVHEWDRSPAALRRKLTAGEVLGAGFRSKSRKGICLPQRERTEHDLPVAGGHPFVTTAIRDRRRLRNQAYVAVPTLMERTTPAM